MVTNTDFSHIMSFVNFMPVGALIGISVSFGLSFITLPILVVHEIIAASITTVLAAYLYRRDESLRGRHFLDRQYLLKLSSICIASLITTAALNIFTSSVLSGVIAASLIPSITGCMSPLCTGLFIKTLSHLWESKGTNLSSVCISALLSYVMIQYTSLPTLIVGVIACTPFISLVMDIRSNKNEKFEGLGLFASTINGCGYAAIAAGVTTVASPLLADAMLVLSWQTPLAYAAIATTTLAVGTLLSNVVIAPAVKAIHSVCENTGDVYSSWEHTPSL